MMVPSFSHIVYFWLDRTQGRLLVIAMNSQYNVLYVISIT